MRKHVKNNVSWVGYIDWELETFHGDDYSIMNGSSQNAYLIEEEKTVLIDTIWTPHRFGFVENLKKEIDLKKIDFIVANHGECDHSGSLTALMDEIPDTPIYCTANCVKSLEGQYGKRGWNFHVVKTGDSVEIGNGKKLVFVEMRMLHWPDSMATYMTGDNILFSNDAFGQHFAVEELAYETRYYCRIRTVGILSAAEYVKVAQAVGVEPVVHRILFGPLLVASFRQRIGREQITLSAFRFREIRFVAVNGRTGGIYKLFDAVLPGSLHHIERALNIVGTVKKRHFYAARHAAPRRLIEHIIHAPAGFHAGVEIFDIPFYKFIIGVAGE